MVDTLVGRAGETVIDEKLPYSNEVVVLYFKETDESRSKDWAVDCVDGYIASKNIRPHLFDLQYLDDDAIKILEKTKKILCADQDTAARFKQNYPHLADKVSVYQ